MRKIDYRYNYFMCVSTTHKANRYPQPITNHSTIFQTFDSNIDKWTFKIGVFGKSFNDIFDSINKRKLDIHDLITYQGLDLDEAKKHVRSFWSYLFSKEDGKDWNKNSFGEIISKENIDSYIAELDLDSAKDKLENMFDWDSKIKKNKATWQDYFDTLDDGEDYIKELIKNTDDLSKLTGEDLVNACDKARDAAIAHNEELKNMTFSAKAGKVAFQALATAGNMLAMWAISKVAEFIHECAAASNRLAESAKSLGSQFSSTQATSIEIRTDTLKTLPLSVCL